MESIGTVRNRLQEIKFGAKVSALATIAEPAAIAEWIWCTAGYCLDWIPNFAIASMAVFERITQNFGDKIVQLFESFQKWKSFHNSEHPNKFELKIILKWSK